MSTAAPSSNLDQITAYLRGKGLASWQIAGVEGNWQIESGLDPNAYNRGENAHGLAQWEGGRWSGPAGLQAFAARARTKNPNASPTDLRTQLDFWWSEMTGPERSSLDALLKTTTPQQAATVFDQKYERSSAASLPARVAAATTFAAGGIVGGSGQVNTGGGGGVQTAGWLDWLLQGVPGGSWADGKLAQVPGGAGGALGEAGGALGTLGLGGFLTSVGHWIVDGAWIIFGAVLIIVAVIVIAKGADAGPTVTLPAAESGGGKTSSAGGGESETAEAAEVAA